MSTALSTENEGCADLLSALRFCDEFGLQTDGGRALHFWDRREYIWSVDFLVDSLPLAIEDGKPARNPAGNEAATNVWIEQSLYIFSDWNTKSWLLGRKYGASMYVLFFVC